MDSIWEERLNSTHISSYIPMTDSFATLSKSIQKNRFLDSIATKFSDRKKIVEFGNEAAKIYPKPNEPAYRIHLSKIYRNAITNSDNYISKHSSPKTMEDKQLLNNVHDIRNAAIQENAVIKNSPEQEDMTIQNILFNTTQSYSESDFDKFQEEKNKHEKSDNPSKNSKYQKAYLKLANQDFMSLNKKEKTAMAEYANNSDAINTALRNHNYEKGTLDAALSNNITNMKKAFTKHNLPKDTTTYKGIDDNMIKYLLGIKGIDKDQANDFLDDDGNIDHEKFFALGAYKLLNGTTFQDKAFMSTTTNKFFARRLANKTVNKTKKSNNKNLYTNTEGAHIMTLNVPKGTRAMFTDTMFTKTGNEKEKNELTLDAGYTYTINNVKPIGPGMYELNTTVNGDIEKIEIDRNQSVIAQRSSESFIGNYSDLYSLLTTLKIRLIAIFPDNRANNIINSINHINFILNGFNPDWITIKRELNNIYEKSIDISEKNVTQLQFNLLRQCIKLSDENETLLRRINYYILKKSILKNGNKVNDAFAPRKMYKTAKNLEQKKYNESYSNVVNSVLSNSEMNIVKDYTSDNYIYYNKVERENDPIKVASRSNKLNKKSNNNQMDDATRISYKKKSDIISKSIDKFTTKKEEIYYRGLSDFNCLKFMLLADVAKKWPNSPNIHNVYNLLTQNIGCNLLEKGYMSVSNNKEISMKFGGNKTTGALLKIIIPPGISALPIMKFSEYNTEEELILNRGTIFEVLSISISSTGVLVITVRVVKK